MSAPSSMIRFAISSREISTLSSAMAFHIKLNFSGQLHTAIISGKSATWVAVEEYLMDLKGVQLTWLGHATFRIDTPAGHTVIIDPWIMNNPACPPFEKKLKHVDG